MLHLPEVLPDETLYSLLARIAVVNGMSNHLQVFEKLFGHKAPASIVNISDGIDRFCDETYGAYGAVDQVRSRLTVFPLLAHLNVFPGHDGVTNSNQATWLDGRAFDYSGNTRNEWRECPGCRGDDEAGLGFSYWRRSHQLPETFFCPAHGEPLKRTILPGKCLHERFWLPHELDAQAVHDSFAFESDVAKALAEIGENALNDDGKPFHPEVIRDTFNEALRDRYLLTRTGKIRWPECLNDFYSTLHYEKRSSVHERLVRQLLMGLQDSSKPLPVQHYVLLVYWLFGAWQRFKGRCKWVATINYPERSLHDAIGATTYAEVDPQTLLDEHRQICMNYLRDNLSATRSEFLKQEYKCFRWLRRNDGKWLDRHLPLSPREGRLVDLFKFPT